MNRTSLQRLATIAGLADAGKRGVLESHELPSVFAEIREHAQKARELPELTGPYAGCRRAFHHFAEAYYSKALESSEDRLDEVYFSVSPEEGGTAGEFCIRWSMLGGEPTACLEVFDEAWGALALFPDVMAAFAERTDAAIRKRIDSHGYWLGEFTSITAAEVCQIARDCGIADVTKREDPYAKAPPPTYSDPRDAALALLHRLMPAMDDKHKTETAELLKLAGFHG